MERRKRKVSNADIGCGERVCRLGWAWYGSQQKVSVAFPDLMSRGLTTPTSTSWETKEKGKGNEK